MRPIAFEVLGERYSHYPSHLVVASGFGGLPFGGLNGLSNPGMPLRLSILPKRAKNLHKLLMINKLPTQAPIQHTYAPMDLH